MKCRSTQAVSFNASLQWPNEALLRLLHVTFSLTLVYRVQILSPPFKYPIDFFFKKANHPSLPFFSKNPNQKHAAIHIMVIKSKAPPTLLILARKSQTTYLYSSDDICDTRLLE